MDEIRVKLCEFPIIRVSLENISTNNFGAGTSHNALRDRDLADQHPISAITGLEQALKFTGCPYTLTEDDKAEIVAAVIEAFGGHPVFGYVDSDNNIVVSGDLADGAYSVKYEMEGGYKVNIGTLVLDSNVYYSITNNLTSCASNNSAARAVEDGSYSAVISAIGGYELKSVVVTMGGADISAYAVSGGNINIASVTGNIVITATAEEAAATPAYTNLFVPSEAQINKRINSSKSIVAQDGYVISNFIDVSDKVPFTSSAKIYVKGATITADGNTKLTTFKSTDGVLTNSYTMQNGSALTVNNLGNGVISISPDASWFVSGIRRMLLVLKVSDSAITAADIQDLVITIDEPIA